MPNQSSPPRIVRQPLVAPGAPSRYIRPPHIIIPPRVINFGNAATVGNGGRPPPGNSPGRKRGGTKRRRNKTRKTRRRYHKA